MRLKLLLAGLLALLPLPALADVTARYSTGTMALTIAVADGGNMRADLDDKVTLIRRDGADYLVAKTAAGRPMVTRLDALTDMMGAQLSGPNAPKPLTGTPTDFELTRIGDESVGGLAGVLWRFGPVLDAADTTKKPLGDKLDFVMSNDPAVAPIGGFFRHVGDLLMPIFGNMFGESNFVQLAGELLDKGTPIRIGPTLKLESVETAKIAEARFELPGPVLQPGEFFEAVTPTGAPQAMPPLP